jgi:hypothetical protein
MTFEGVPNVLRRQSPGIAQVRCERIQFQPGDRVLACHFGPLDEDQRRKMTKMIRRWAGCEVEVLIYDSSRWDIEVEKKSGGIQ